jgi:L1 cell adhesion molecule like protein
MAAIGIDLGTTYSCVGVFRFGKVEIIADHETGQNTVPSYVMYDETGRTVGHAAKLQLPRNPNSTIYDAKRLIGRRMDDPSVQSELKNFSFKVDSDGNGLPLIKPVFTNGAGVEKTLSFKPEEISAEVLRHLKNSAEKYLGTPVTEAVITTPAYFNDSQRQSTRDAATIAGLKVLRIINEPTAACMAYGFDKLHSGTKNILVFDLGGGTFDVSLLNVSCDEAGSVFEVLATCGDTHLGGEDFDNRIVKELVSVFKRQTGIDLTDNKRALGRLKAQAESAKRSLSSSVQVDIVIDAISDGRDFQHKLSRARFEELCSDKFKDCLKPIDRVLSDAKLDKSSVDEIVLVGGSTRIPKIRKLVEDYFNGKQLNMSINADEAVAYGAALQAAILSGAHKDNDKLKSMVLLDVTPLSIGVMVNGELMDVLIKRNTTIPTVQNKEYTTGSPNQTNVEIVILEGERKMARDNNQLGKFQLTIPPAPMGKPKIKVTFDIDANGILNVSAVDEASGKNSKLVIKNDSGRLTAEQIEAKIKEAEQFAEQDRINAERSQTKSSFEQSLYALKSIIDGEGENTQIKSHPEYETVKSGFDEIQSWNDNNPNATIEQYKEHIGKLSALGAKLYNNGAPNSASAPTSSQQPVVEEVD